MTRATDRARCNLCGADLVIAESVRWRKDGFEIVECGECGLIFRAQLPQSSELEEIYGPGYFRRGEADDAGQGYGDYLAEEEVHRLASRRRLRLLTRLGADGPLLDVGCAGGFFLDEAGGLGWAVEGVDVSAAMAEFAQEELGLAVHTGQFSTVHPTSANFGCITMWDYLEHSSDPLGELRRARSLLSEQGLLGISTGDAATLVARISGSRWHLLTPRHHNYFFTMATLRRALASAGFEVIWSGHPGGRYTVRYLAHKVRTAAPRSRVLAWIDDRLAKTSIAGLAIPVNLWDIATVIARPAPESSAGARA